MSIITTWEAVPSRLFSIYAALLDAPSGEAKERLEAWATPPALRNRGSDEDESISTALFSRALREAFALGLVEVDGDKLRVPDTARGYAKGTTERERPFQRFMLDTLLDKERAQSTQQSGFMMALAWFLSKSPLKPFSFRSDPHNTLKADLGDAMVSISAEN